MSIDTFLQENTMYTYYRLLGILTVILSVSIGYADVPRLLTYQGMLSDSLGNPLDDGDYSLTFSIYDAAEGGTQLWTSGAQSVRVTGRGPITII